VVASLWLATLLVLAAESTQAQASQSGSMQREFQAAMAAEDKGDMEGAERLLSALHARHPGVFEIDESLGLLYASRDENARALPLLEAAARERPRSDVAHANYGTALFKLHRNQEALAELKLAAKLNPANAATQQSLGQVLLEELKPELAAAAFAAAGQPALAQSLLGDVDEKNGDFKSAAQHYARAVELEPSEANVWTLGMEFLRHWTFEAAITEFEAAAVKFPASERMKLGLGVGYFGNSNYAKALPVFADLLKSNPSNGLYAELLGISCSVPMEEDKARCGELVGYAEGHPEEARIDTYAAAWMIGEGGEGEQRAAQGLLERAVAADPKLADAHFQLGLLKQNQGDWAGSVGDLEAALALKQDHAQAHYRLAQAYGHVGRKEDGKREMDLNRKFAKQQQEDLNQRLNQITGIAVEVHK
jgi:tetratricopeptide (TPR) repeat protein